MNTLFSGKAGRRSGNEHPNITPYASYATATDPISLAVGNDRQFRRMCEILEQAELADDERYATNAQRAAHRKELRQELENLFQHHEAQALFEKLVFEGVPCGVIHNSLEALNHPHTAHRNMVVEIDGFRSVGSPIKLSRTPASYRLPPSPAIGADTRKVLIEAGLSEQQIERLCDQGVIREPTTADTGH